MQIHIFILEDLPQALDKDLLAPRTLTVHARVDAVLRNKYGR
jgi:hypothetical protein